MKRYRVSISWNEDRNLIATFVYAINAIEAGKIIVEKYGPYAQFRVQPDM